MNQQLALANYRRLVRRIGRGFHPDTRGADYSRPLPSGYGNDDVDRIVRLAREHGVDVYAVACEVLEVYP